MADPEPPGSGLARKRGIFVSYRRADSAGEAGRLADHLGAIFGTECIFFDVAAIAGGDDWRQRLDTALDACDTMLVVIGRLWLDASGGARRIDDPKDMVAWEVGRGLSRGLRVVQVLVQGITPPAAETLPPPIAGLAMRQAVSLRHESFAADVRELGAQLRRLRRTRSLFAGEWRSSDLSKWLPRVIDCGIEGTVAAVSIVDALELLLARSGAAQALSVRYLYEKVIRSQQDAQRGDARVTEGTFMQPALFVAGFFGVPLEAVWPYVPGRRALPAGRTWRTLDAGRGWCCKGDFFRADGLADAVRQLAAGRPVLTTAMIDTTSWFGPKTMKSGVVSMPVRRGDQGSGGMGTVLLTGYDAPKRQFRFVGPWGEGWGRRGFGTLELDVARQVLNADSLWSVELTADTVASLREQKALKSAV